MRLAEDDPIRTPNARCLAVVGIVLFVVMEVMSSVPVATVADVNKHHVTYHLRVLYICDDTSDEVCTANKTMYHISQFSSLASNNSRHMHGCGDSNIPCDHSVNSTTQTDSSAFEYHLDSDHVILTKAASDTSSVRFNLTYHIIEGNVRKKISYMDKLVTLLSADVMVVVGDSKTVQTAAIVADGHGIPVLGYNTELGDGPQRVHGATYVPMNPGPEAQGKALTQIIGHFNMKHTTVIIESSKYADTFLNGIRQTVQIRKQDIFNVLPLDTNIGTNVLRQKLTDLSNKGLKVIVLHCSPELMLRVVTVALSTRLYNSGYAWFLSEMAFSRDPDIIAQLPEGLLAIDSFWVGEVPNVMVTALDYLMSATMCVLKDSSSRGVQVPYRVEHYKEDLQKNFSSEGEKAQTARHIIPVGSLRNSTEFSYYFQRCLRNMIVFCDNITRPTSNETRAGAADRTNGGSCTKTDNVDTFLDNTGRNNGPAFFLLNTVDDGMGDRIWAKVGYITASGQRDLRTVLWPGHSIYGPSSNVVKTYKVVTRPAEPFVFINTQVSRKEECLVQIYCLQVANSTPSLLTTVVDDFQSDMKHVDKLYTVHCCNGLALEMLNALAVDLNFRYVVYFVNDTNYGTVVNDKWTGMVADVINGAADIIAGAFSVTSERMNVLDFTEPFFQNKLSMVTAESGSSVSIWAFLSPFSGQVWLCIFLSSIVAGVATSFLEWRSPFGLNPRGRKRTKNYGLGSGLLMVMVLLTGHTINIKAPKSWPGKVIQNVWAGLAIFIMTSYTANLAAHLAGQSAVTSVKSVYDADLLAKRVAVIPYTAIESYVEKTTPELSKRAMMSYVDSTITAINMLRNHSIDIYLDDTPLLEYGLAKYNKDCKIRIAGPGKEFGSEGYAFGLPRYSWLQIPISNQISRYAESGYIQELAKKYLSHPQCEHFFTGTAHPYGLEHTGGLFIIMVSAVFISVLFLILEHLAYQYLVPWLRKQPADSFWKTENFAFISQRVFRVVRSEKLYSQKQAAQEMITIVKQRDFTKLIQKHELQKRRAATQKRVKTKAEVFRDITANIVSYHRQLQSAPETAENSHDEADTEALEDVRVDIIDNISSAGVNNIAYSGVNSDLVMRALFRKGDMRLKQHDSCSDEDDHNVVFPPNIKFNDKNDVDRSKRIFKSRSWVVPDGQSGLSLVRQGSESYVLVPTKHSDLNREYRRSWNGPSYKSCKISPRKICDLENTFSKCSSVSMFDNNENCYSDKSPNTEYSNVSVNTPSSPMLSFVHEFPPPGQSNSYYYSASSSSIHSPSDEPREFSPLSSPTSTNNEDFSGCDESVEGVSTISPNSSNSWSSPGPHFQDSDSQTLDSQDSGSQTSVDPLLLNKKSKELSLNPSMSGISNPDRMSYQCTNYELPTRLSYQMKTLPHKALSRSQSAGSFSNNNNTNTLDSQSGNKINTDIDNSVFGRSLNNAKEGESLLSEGCTNKDSDSSPIKNTAQLNQQQNKTQRTRSCDNSRRNYFTQKLKQRDNRITSLRRHDTSGHQNRLSADFIGEYAFDALSKEDVLLLWKKSEIELEKRLQEVLARNRRLGLAIDYLTKRDRCDDVQEV